MAGSTGNKFTPENAAEMGRKGGIASGEKRRKKKNERERYKALLNMALDKGKAKDIEDIKNFAAIEGKNISVGDAIAVTMVQRALMGDRDAAKLIYGLIGEVNPQATEESAEVSDDGFLKALGATAADDWGDYSDG